MLVPVRFLPNQVEEHDFKLLVFPPAVIMGLFGSPILANECEKWYY